MNRLLFIPVVLVVLATSASAQTDAAVDALGKFSLSQSVTALEPSNGILSNSISNIGITGDSVWIGPYLNVTGDAGDSWEFADTPQLFGTQNRVFSLSVNGSIIIAGLGYNDLANDGLQTAAGFLVSTDGGESFQFRSTDRYLDAPGDTLVQYGASELSALDVIVPQQSPPYDIEYDPSTSTLYAAGWAAGVRRSTDLGVNWERVVLPPDDLDEIFVDSTYDFKIEPRRGNLGNFNHMGFAVHVAGDGTVWAGTPLGVNRSTDGGLSWKRTSADGTSTGLTGNWVVAIDERVHGAERSIWLATWAALETGDLGGRNGVSVTRDGGETYEQVLVGERFIDFAFDGDRIWVAGRESGLFYSDDDGKTWETIRDFPLASSSEREVKVGSDVLSVAAQNGVVWVGTSDGLLRSDNGGVTWRTFRVEVPLHPESESELVPDVETFAYPNPFSPIVDQFIRIRFEVPASGPVDVRIYDFRMNEIRRLPVETRDAGVHEFVWDGANGDGTRLSNGTYFYSVKAGGKKVWGKILLVE